MNLRSTVIIKDVETNTFDTAAWEDQTHHPSSAAFVSHKSVLRIAMLVPTPRQPRRRGEGLRRLMK